MAAPTLLRPDAFRPLSERIVLKPDKPPTHVGRIIIPESARKRSDAYRAEVVAMGPGMLTKAGGRWPMPDIKVGDIVYFDPRVFDYCTTFKVDGETLIVVYPERVLAVEEES